MSGTHGKRLAKLEAVLPKADDLSRWTWDEINAALLDAGEAPTGVSAEAVIRGSELKELLRQTAYHQRSNPKHIEHYAAIWARRSDVAYVPSLFGDEDFDFDFPNVMVRRKALRSRPAIRAILDEVTVP